jgi:serine/threonine protein kinase
MAVQRDPFGLTGKAIGEKGDIHLDTFLEGGQFATRREGELSSAVYRGRVKLAKVDLSRIDLATIVRDELYAGNIVPQDVGLDIRDPATNKEISYAEIKRMSPIQISRMIMADPSMQKKIIERVSRLRNVIKGGTLTYNRIIEAFGPTLADKEVPVAVKVFPHGQHNLQDFFQREMDIVTGLPRHPNIVNAYGGSSDTVNGIDYILMELVEEVKPGLRNLENWVKDIKQPIPYDASFGIVRDLISAVVHMYSQGIVHRDLKPGNVLLAKALPGRGYSIPVPKYDGSGHIEIQWIEVTPKVIDLGIAKAIQKSDIKGAQAKATKGHDILGTPGYLSPEQARGLGLTSKSDLFSVGSIFYYLLSGGQDAFKVSEGTAVALASQVITSDPTPVTDYNPGVPALVVDFLERLLEKDWRARIEPERAFWMANRRYEKSKKIIRGVDLPNFEDIIERKRVEIGELEEQIKRIESGEVEGSVPELNRKVGELYLEIAEEVPRPTKKGLKPYKFTSAHYDERGLGHVIKAAVRLEEVVSQFHAVMVGTYGEQGVSKLLDEYRKKTPTYERAIETDEARFKHQLARVISTYIAHEEWELSKELIERLMRDLGGGDLSAISAIKGLALEYTEIIRPVRDAEALLHREEEVNNRYKLKDRGKDVIRRGTTSVSTAIRATRATNAYEEAAACVDIQDAVYQSAIANIETVRAGYHRLESALTARKPCTVQDATDLLHMLEATKTGFLAQLKSRLPDAYAIAMQDVEHLEGDLNSLLGEINQIELFGAVIGASDDRVRADAVVKLGMYHLDKGDFAAALLHFNAVPASMYEVGEPYRNLANLLFELRDRKNWIEGGASLTRQDLQTYRDAKDDYSVTSNPQKNEAILPVVRDISAKGNDEVQRIASDIEKAIRDLNLALGAPAPDAAAINAEKRSLRKRIYELEGEIDAAVSDAELGDTSQPTLKPNRELVEAVVGAFGAIQRPDLFEKYMAQMQYPEPFGEIEDCFNMIRSEQTSPKDKADSNTILGVYCLRRAYIREAWAYFQCVPADLRRPTEKDEYELSEALLEFDRAGRARATPSGLSQGQVEDFAGTIRSYNPGVKTDRDKQVLASVGDIVEKASITGNVVEDIAKSLVSIQGGDAERAPHHRERILHTLSIVKNQAYQVLMKDSQPVSHDPKACEGIAATYERIGAEPKLVNLFKSFGSNR